MDTRRERWVEALRKAFGNEGFRGDGLYVLVASLECLRNTDHRSATGRMNPYWRDKGPNFKESI